MTDQDRPAALLTEAQRLFYLTDEDRKPATERSMRRRIRERVRAGVIDFSILLEHMDPDDIERAFSVGDLEPGKPIPILNGINSAFGLFYLGVTPKGEEENLDPYIQHVGAGIREGVARRGKSINELEVRGEIEVGASLEEVAQGDLSEVPLRTLKQLLFAEEITETEFSEAVIEKNEDSGE